MLPQRRGAVAVIMRQDKLLVIRRSHLVVAPGADPVALRAEAAPVDGARVVGDPHAGRARAAG